MLTLVAFLLCLIGPSSSEQMVVRGTAVNASGLPVPLVKVRAGHSQTSVEETDANGRFTIALPRSEPVNLFIEPPHGIGSGCVIPLLTDSADSLNIVVRLDSAKGAQFTFVDSENRAARFAHLHLALYRTYLEFVDTLQSLQRERRDTAPFFRTWMDSAEVLKRLVRTENDRVIGGEYLLRYYRLTSIHGMVFDSSFYREHIMSIPSHSPLWFFNNYEAYDQISVRPDGKAFVDTILETHPSRELRAFLLFNAAMEAQSASDNKEVRRNYLRLKEEFSDVSWAKIADQWILVDVKVKRGAQVPDFSFTDMDDSTVVYSKSSLKGAVYLLDFWATWCLPCIGEIPYLQKAYDRYHSKGLQIISISSDQRRSDVIGFRKQKAQMSWSHVWVPDESRKAVYEQFEVTGIPKPILVNRDGLIIGMKSEVRGDSLETMLQKLFDR